MTNADRLKAWAARKRQRTKEQGSSPQVVAPSIASRDDGLRNRSYLLVEHRNGQMYPVGSSVSVKQIAFLHGVARKAPVEIVAQFARELTFAQCHAALCHYYLHKSAVDAELVRDEEQNAPGVLAGTGRLPLPRLGLRELAGVSEG